MLCRWGHSSSALWRHGPLTTTLPAQASALWRHGPLATTPASPGLCKDLSLFCVFVVSREEGWKERSTSAGLPGQLVDVGDDAGQ